jgi:hypothetical protein
LQAGQTDLHSAHTQIKVNSLTSRHIFFRFNCFSVSFCNTRIKVLEFKLEDARQQRAKEAEMMTRVIESARIAGELKVS